LSFIDAGLSCRISTHFIPNSALFISNSALFISNYTHFLSKSTHLLSNHTHFLSNSALFISKFTHFLSNFALFISKLPFFLSKITVFISNSADSQRLAAAGRARGPAVLPARLVARQGPAGPPVRAAAGGTAARAVGDCGVTGGSGAVVVVALERGAFSGHFEMQNV
jgi:hypothetical protein